MTTWVYLEHNVNVMLTHQIVDFKNICTSQQYSTVDTTNASKQYRTFSSILILLSKVTHIFPKLNKFHNNYKFNISQKFNLICTKNRILCF